MDAALTVVVTVVPLFNAAVLRSARSDSRAACRRKEAISWAS